MALLSPERELSGLRAREEPKRDEARPESARNMEHPSRRLVQPLPVTRTQMLEPELSPRCREADLPAVQMPRENEVERARLEPLDHVGEMREEDANVGVRIGEALRPARFPAPR